jgi:hypothetical protein
MFDMFINSVMLTFYNLDTKHPSGIHLYFEHHYFYALNQIVLVHPGHRYSDNGLEFRRM